MSASSKGKKLDANNKMPAAYRAGVQNFYGRDFLVTPDVLIPRPETEQVVDLALSLAGKQYLPGVKVAERVLPEHPVIYDVGTGSGCIAVTLALEIPEARVVATDISPAAISVAKKNAAKYGTKLSFIIAHLLEKVNTVYANSAADLCKNCGKLDIESVGAAPNLPLPDLVVANLPYVDPEWDWLDKEALGYEPKTALYAANRGLALIKELIIQCEALRVPRLILEADPCQHAEICDFAAQHGYLNEKIAGFALSFRTA